MLKRKSSAWLFRTWFLGLLSILISVTYAEVSHAAGQKEVSKQNDQQLAVVYGKVTNKEGEAIPNAKIEYTLEEFQSQTRTKHVAQTDEYGNYRIEASATDYDYIVIYVTAENYIKSTGTDYMLYPGEENKYDVELYQSATIVGTVKNKAGKPVPGAKIIVDSVNNNINGISIMTDKNGRYIVTGVDPYYFARIFLYVKSDDYLDYVTEYPLYLQPGEIRREDVTLVDAAHVQGRVVDENGNPLVGVQLNISDTKKATTDAEGNYVIKRLPAGKVTILAELAGYSQHAITVMLVNGNQHTVDFVLIKKLDNKAPVTKYRLTTITDIFKGKTYVKGFTFRLQATDEKDGSGVKSTQYRFNGGEWNNYSGPVKFYAAYGVNTVEYFSTDNAGNKEKVNKMDFVNGTFDGAGSY